MYRIKYYRTAEDYVYNKGIVSVFEVDYTLEKIERFVEWYCSITGYIPIVERMQNGEQPFFFLIASRVYNIYHLLEALIGVLSAFYIPCDIVYQLGTKDRQNAK